jgi:hypothetical protein
MAKITKNYWGEEENEALRSYLTDASLSNEQKNLLFTKKLYNPFDTMINGIIFKHNIQRSINSEDETFENNLTLVKNEIFYNLFILFQHPTFTINFEKSVFNYLTLIIRNMLFNYVKVEKEILNKQYSFDQWMVINDIEDDFNINEHFDYQTIILKTIEVIEKSEKEQLIQQKVNKTILKILKNSELSKQIIDAENPETEFIMLVTELSKLKIEIVLPKINKFKNKYNVIIELLENVNKN